MCLGIPGCVIDLYVEHGVAMGHVDFAGVSRAVCLDHVPDVKPGEYVLVHVGFALQKLDEAEARRVFDFLESAQIDEGLG